VAAPGASLDHQRGMQAASELRQLAKLAHDVPPLGAL